MTYANSDIAVKAFTVVVNKTGIFLQSTDGIGTTAFYELGTILVINASILLVTHSRMKAE